MASSSSRFPSKFFLFLLIVSLIIASFNLPVIFRTESLKIKNTIEKESTYILDKDVYIGDIGFLPYGKVILKDIKIQDKGKRYSLVEIGRFDIQFNILEFLINKSRLKKAKGFNLKGIIVFKKPDFIEPIKYKLNVLIGKNVISIGSLLLDSGKSDLEIKGNINDYPSNPRVDFIVTSREIRILEIAKINNLYGDIRLLKDGIIVKNLVFFLNDFPIGVNMKLADFKSPAIELDLTSYPGQIYTLRPFNPFNFELKFSGNKLEDSLKGDLIIKTQKLISVNPREAYDSVLRVNDLSCKYSNKITSIAARDIIYQTYKFGETLEIKASDFKTLLYAGKKRICLTGLNVSLYQGIVKAIGFLDFHGKLPELLLDFKAYRLDIMELAKALKQDYELKGGMDFKGIFNNRRNPCITGRLDISDGYLKNTELLGMLSDFLKVPSLKDLYFDSISSMASLSLLNKEIIFNNIIVSGKDINLKGNIKIKNTKKINGNLSVQLATALLKESFKLRLLFFIIGERLPYQDFEFEIGGFINSPQIKWLSTRFRENVKKYLSEGGKISLEKYLEEAIDQLIK